MFVRVELSFLPSLMMALAAACVSASASAADELPSWQGTDTRIALTNERPGVTWVSALNRSWDDLPDGGVVMLAFDDFARLRKLGADGTTRWEFRPGSAGRFRQDGNLTVRHDGVGGAYLMIDGVDYTCDVWRIDSDGHLAWRRPANGTTDSMGKCVELHVLGDGSVIAATTMTIARRAADGSAVWNATSAAQIIDTAISPTGALWVLTWVPGGHGGVRRYDLAGALLGTDTFACDACVRSLLMNLDFAANGDVLVVGQGGRTTGQLGAFARYDANGQRQLVALDGTTDHYMEVGHDDAGNEYVRAENAVSRVDPGSGSVLWSKPFGEMLPIADGVLVATSGRVGLVDLAITRYAADGTSPWTRTLATSVYGYIDAPKMTPLGPTFQVQQDYDGSPACGESPQLVTLDVAGSVIRDMRACTSQLPTQAVGVDARVGVGVLEVADAMLVMRDASGQRRWQHELCAWCDFGNVTEKRFAAVLNDDGGAWLLARRDGATPALLADRLERIDPTGATVVSTPINHDYGGQSERALLLRGIDDVVVMTYSSNGADIEWLRVDNAGVVRAMATLPIGCTPSTCTYKAQRRPDGGADIVVTTRSCSDRCYPVVTWQVRADGSEIRHFGPLASTADHDALLASDGSLMVVSSDRRGFQLQTFAADGTADAPLRIDGIAPALETTFALHGPLQGALLMVVGGVPPSYASWIVRVTDGVVLAQRYGLEVHAGTPWGYIVAPNSQDLGSADLLDPLTLQYRQHFELPSDVPLPYDYVANRRPATHWIGLSDGTVYATDTILTDEPMIRTRTSRFAVTGSPADDSIYAHGFE